MHFDWKCSNCLQSIGEYFGVWERTQQRPLFCSWPCHTLFIWPLIPWISCKHGSDLEMNYKNKSINVWALLGSRVKVINYLDWWLLVGIGTEIKRLSCLLQYYLFLISTVERTKYSNREFKVTSERTECSKSDNKSERFH